VVFVFGLSFIIININKNNTLLYCIVYRKLNSEYNKFISVGEWLYT